MPRELPIFPLPIVLFPGAPQPLHIFEPRYRQLLADCQDGDRRFGIAYVAPDPTIGADPMPDPGDVTTLAADVRAGFARLARALGVLTEQENEPVELAPDPQLLSFQVAAALELDADAKRALQAIRSTTLRLRQLATVLGPLAVDAERRAVVRQRARGNGRGGRHPEI